MTSNRIIVCMNSESQASRVTGVACAIARQSQARLVGMSTTEVSSDDFTGSMYMMPANATESEQEAARCQDDRVQQAFNRVTADQHADSEWQNLDPGSSDVFDRLRNQTQNADLVVVPQTDPLHESSAQMRLWREILDSACCPVLVVPRADELETISQSTLAVTMDNDNKALEV